ncbi:citryl-CoA lyase [Pusillimonas sp. SM2304]|nr:citryl-CoA lyase [Pusillimonas sp. SM2304]MDS1139048.1 citryl-CoA lyase [Pusillimonas sp. SM2304]
MAVLQNKPVGFTSIAKVEADRVTIRGKDLCSELIGKTSFTWYFLFLITGKEPSPNLVALADASLVAIAEHGFVPSVQAARMTYAAAPDAIQGAVAAGLLGCGSVILGASETAGHLLREVIDRSASKPCSYDEAASEILQALRASKSPVPGFGHPIHRNEDPRATQLLHTAAELGAAGEHVQALDALARNMEASFGRFLPMNVSAAIPAVLLDAGFPLAALRGVPLVARTGSLVAHLLEEGRSPLGFRMAASADAMVEYVEAGPGLQGK